MSEADSLIHATTISSQPCLETAIERRIQEQKATERFRCNERRKGAQTKTISKEGLVNQGVEEKKKKKITVPLLVPCARALCTVRAVEPVGKRRAKMLACALKNVPFSLLFFHYSCLLSLSLSPYAPMSLCKDNQGVIVGQIDLFFCQKTKGWDCDDYESDPPQAQNWSVKMRVSCLSSIHLPFLLPPTQKKSFTHAEGLSLFLSPST